MTVHTQICRALSPGKSREGWLRSRFQRLAASASATPGPAVLDTARMVAFLALGWALPLAVAAHIGLAR